MSNKSLVIAQFPDDLKQSLSITSNPKNTTVLGLFPESRDLAQHHGYEVLDTTLFFNAQSHKNCLLKLDDIFSEWPDDMNISDQIGLTNTYSNKIIFSLRLLLSNILFHIEVFSNALKDIHPDRVIFSRYKEQYHQLKLQGDDSIVRHLMDTAPFRSLLNADAPAFGGSKIFVKKMVRPFLAKGFSTPKNQVLLQKMKRLKKGILTYGLGYNLDQLVKDLQPGFVCVLNGKRRSVQSFQKDMNCPIYDYQLGQLWAPADKIFKQSVDVALALLLDRIDQSEVLSFRGWSFKALLYEWVEQSFCRVLNQFRREFYFLNELFAKSDFKCVLSAISRQYAYGLGELAKRHSVPAFLMSHGSHVPYYDDKIARLEWEAHSTGLINTDYQYHLLQSPWARRHVENFNFDKNYIDVQAHVFAKLGQTNQTTLGLRKRHPGKKIVVHAGTPKYHHNMRFHIYETVDEYLKNIVLLASHWNDCPDIVFIVRFRPSEFISNAILQNHLKSYSNVVISSEGSFADVLSETDLLVSFSSTTIEEALLNNVPVLLFEPEGRYHHLPGQPCYENGFKERDSVYCVDKPNHLKVALQWIVQHDFYQAADDQRFQFHQQSTAIPTACDVIQRVMLKNDSHKAIYHNDLYC